MNKREAHKAVDTTLSHQERVSIALQAYGTQDVYFDLDTLAGATGLTRAQVYQALYRLNTIKQLEILVEPIENTGRNRVRGVHLIKLESAESILESVPERALKEIHQAPKSVKKAELKIRETAPSIIMYMEKKVVIEKIKEQVAEVGMDPEVVINFEINPICEEGILLLNEWVNIQRAYTDLAVRCEAMEREIANLRGLKQPLPMVAEELETARV